MQPSDPPADDPRNRPSDRLLELGASEAERLAVLDRYAILDTPPEPKFDELVQLAADICETPIALLSFIAGNRQWFKAEIGFGFRETPLDASICVHMLLRPGLTVIPDLMADDRFACNPLVLGGPLIRFYAGVVLVSHDGMPLGTLCVLDVEARPQGLSDWQGRALTTLATQAMDSLELRRLLVEREGTERRKRRAAAHRAQVVLDSISDGVFALDSKRRFTLFNRAAEVLFARARRDVLGRSLASVFPEALPDTLDQLRKVMEAGTSVSFETPLASRPGRLVQIRAAPMDGGLAVSFTDITERKRTEEAQQLLIAELQHRTRNLLAVVRSIATQTAGASDSLGSFVNAFNSRLSALSRAQSVLSQGGGTGAPLRELVEGELAAHGARIDGERIRVEGPHVDLGSKAVQIVALALHELATNALKYGALAQPQARLSVSWELADKEGAPIVSIRWAEEGVRLPSGPPPPRRGFGRQLIERALPYDLGADTRFSIVPDGVRCEIDVPLRK